MTRSPADRGRYDVAVIGAGPAGMAASISAARTGAKVALLDAADRPGGQYWRHRPGDTAAQHQGWRTFSALRNAFHEHAEYIDHLSGHSVWQVTKSTTDTPGWHLHATAPTGQRLIKASALILATGAYDRQVPFPGWTLPGVFTAGAVQALLKGHGVLAGKRFAVGGTGPFLLAVAAGLADAGADVVGVYEAGSPMGLARSPITLMRNMSKLSEGASYIATLARHRIPYHTRSAIIAAHGESEVCAVSVAKVDRSWDVVTGSETTVACDTVAVGFGFTPQLELALQLGCDTRLDSDGSLVAVADERQRSSTDTVYLAGEVCGVAGAAASIAEGHIAGLHAAAHITARPVDRATLRRLHRQRNALRSFAAAMHATFSVPSGWTSWLQPDTTVCRCEEVPVSAIDEAIEAFGAIDARAAKLYARAGMGMCQGRVCGYAASCLIAARSGSRTTADDLSGLAHRPIGQPVTLGALASGIE